LARFFHEQTPVLSSPGTHGAVPACLFQDILGFWPRAGSIARELSRHAKCQLDTKTAVPDRFHSLRAFKICGGIEPWFPRIFPHWRAICARP
jgi:hypothetical protein